MPLYNRMSTYDIKLTINSILRHSINNNQIEKRNTHVPNTICNTKIVFSFTTIDACRSSLTSSKLLFFNNKCNNGLWHLWQLALSNYWYTSISCDRCYGSGFFTIVSVAIGR